MQFDVRRRASVPAALLVLTVLAAAGVIANKGENGGIRVVPNEAARRVDVFVDGKPFTSYIWPVQLMKPVLFPLRTSAGTIVTRGYPLEPRAGERVDHPHQVGLWFNYGDVNGVDFWNNSDRLKPEERGRMGTIRHVKINRVSSGKERGELDVLVNWVMPDLKTAVRENTTFVFHASEGVRAIDRITRLTAAAPRVVFRDNKEGVLGMRVARWLEQPSNRPEVFTDASGKPTSVPVLDNKGVSGLYVSSEGRKGDDVWGTRAKWTLLSGKLDNEPVSLAILDHPGNPGYPTYWHARGYGLFAANPLGQKALSGGKEELNLTLDMNETVIFRHRILVISGPVTPQQVEEHHRRFIAVVK